MPPGWPTAGNKSRRNRRSTARACGSEPIRARISLICYPRAEGWRATEARRSGSVRDGDAAGQRLAGAAEHEAEVRAVAREPLALVRRVGGLKLQVRVGAGCR